jgi:hypothetical protein
MSSDFSRPVTVSQLVIMVSSCCACSFRQFNATSSKYYIRVYNAVYTRMLCTDNGSNLNTSHSCFFFLHIFRSICRTEEKSYFKCLLIILTYICEQYGAKHYDDKEMPDCQHTDYSVRGTRDRKFYSDWQSYISILFQPIFQCRKNDIWTTRGELFVSDSYILRRMMNS